MKIVIAGGTGFIGQALTRALLDGGHEVAVFTRTGASRLPPGVKAVRWPADNWPEDGSAGAGGLSSQAPWMESLMGAEAVVNLAGESIAAKRWTPEQKQRIRDSRVKSTRTLADALERLSHPPRILVSGSAVGYYGPGGDEELDETAPPGNDFLSRVCREWECEAKRAEALGGRVVLLRTGLVLGPNGGALPKMLLPFRLFAGGPVGSGRQWMPWIHLDDLISLIRCVLENDQARGPVNGTAPAPVTNREFSRTLGQVLRRPSWLPAPAFALRLILGEMAEALLLSGQRAVPKKALELGFGFQYPELEPALRNILG